MAQGPGAGPPPEAKEVDFRVPLLRKSELDSSLGLVCLDQKVFVLDFDSIGEALRRVTEKDFETAVRQARGQKNWVTVKGGVLTVKAGDFNLRVSVKEDPAQKGSFFLRKELVLKSGSKGETLEQARTPGSVFQTRLSKLDPARHNLQFCVFPDSHDTFRELRKIVWERKFTDVGWLPFHVGEPIRIGSGVVSVQ